MTMSAVFENSNPKIYQKSENRLLTADEEDDSVYDEIDCREVFDLLRNVAVDILIYTNIRGIYNGGTVISRRDLGLSDPEYPLTLEELNVVDQDLITVCNSTNEIKVNFTPTVPHCSMATLIGLSLRVQLLRSLPSRFKVSVKITPGSHASEEAVNKQLNDKERVAAALENSHLSEVINHCIGKHLKMKN